MATATVPSSHGPFFRSHDELLTLKQACVALGLSASSIRRWADEGRLRTERTAGGHRRFLHADVRRVQRERPAASPALRAIELPARPAPGAADLLAPLRTELVDRIGAVLYEPGAA